MAQVKPVAFALMVLVALAVAPAARATAPVAGATRLGGAPSAKPLMLDLPLRTDAAALARFAESVSDPSSSQYGAYRPVSMLARRFGAPAGERARVLHYLRSVGARGVSIDSTGQFARATMPVATAERVFATALSTFGAATTSGIERYVAPTAPARIPPALAGAVTGVVGLDTAPFAEPQPTLAANASGSGSARLGSGYEPRSGTPRGCRRARAVPYGFTPNQYRAAYDIGISPAATGRGERVALIEIDGFKRSDIAHFANCFGRRLGKIKVVHVGIDRDLRPSFETTLDLEMLVASAPGVFARGVGVYQTRPQTASVLRALTAPLRRVRDRPDVISVSLGICEPFLTHATSGRSGAEAINRTLEVAAATGISVISASGDDGSTACTGDRSPDGLPLRLKAVSFPASSPWVTGVGGTNIKLTRANRIAGQVVWNDSPGLPEAGGGGYSRLFQRPAYQRAAISSRHRVVPDVSMLADPYPGFLIYCSARPGCVNRSNRNPWTPFGGTSAGSPLLAGAFALVDAQLRSHGRPNLGFANPLLYRIDRSSLGPHVFSDVIRGSNDVFAPRGRAVGCCTAAPGFDPASGLGSVNVGALTLASLVDTRAYARVALAVPRQRHVLHAGRLRVRVHCSRPCLFIAYASIAYASSRARHARGSVTARTPPRVLRRPGWRTVTVSLRRRARRRLASALHDRGRVSADVSAAIVDPTGKIEHHTRPVHLRLRH